MSFQLDSETLGAVESLFIAVQYKYCSQELCWLKSVQIKSHSHSELSFDELNNKATNRTFKRFAIWSCD